MDDNVLLGMKVADQIADRGFDSKSWLSEMLAFMNLSLRQVTQAAARRARGQRLAASVSSGNDARDIEQTRAEETRFDFFGRPGTARRSR